MIQTIPQSLGTIEATGYQNQWKYGLEAVVTKLSWTSYFFKSSKHEALLFQG